MAEQTWDPGTYAATASFVPALGQPVLELLAPRPGERVLDLGCGDGALTAELVSSGAAVVGVDSSPEMVRAARARGIDARLAEASALDFDAEFDAVFSNAVLHWVDDHDAVAAGVRRALRPGGRFVGEFGGFGNTPGVGVAVNAALRLQGLAGPGNPWHFPTAEEFAGVLRAAGFTVASCELIPRPTPVPDGLRAWLDVFGAPLLGSAPAELRDTVLDQAVELAAPWLRDRTGAWIVDYMRLRFDAVLPG